MTEAAMSSTAPAKASLAAETTPATATPVKRLVPTAITLLLRDDGTLVLRAESPNAVDGFYNVDRDENSPQARWRMRRRGQELARQHGSSSLISPRPSPREVIVGQNGHCFRAEQLTCCAELGSKPNRATLRAG
jgi:hypothetical protein